MACCELVKLNITIIIIQRITNAFDCAVDCAFNNNVLYFSVILLVYVWTSVS